MNKLLINFMIELVIPIALYINAKNYLKNTDIKEIPKKGGFRTKYSMLNVENFEKVNALAYKVNSIIVPMQVIVTLVACFLQYMYDYNPTKMYVIVVAIELFSHFLGTFFIQFMQKK